ncbi:MAG: glucuronate isomerase [Nocardioidaceae bacterium]
MAGAYSAVKLGAPWWYLDSPDGMRRFRELVTETAGFYNTSGFVDDTRAFLSIPARHDLSRRIDAGYLARLVAEHRLEEDEAGRDRRRPGLPDPARLLPAPPRPPRTLIPRRLDAGDRDVRAAVPLSADAFR